MDILYTHFSIFTFMLILTGADASTPLYCGFRQSFYEVGQSWNHQCHRYNCTLNGVIAKPLYQCTNTTAPSVSSGCTLIAEPTDQQSCCTEEFFCQEMTLPPNGINGKPATYSCPEGWILLSHGNNSSMCMKTYDDPLPYKEAQERCRANGAFLVNLETTGLIRTVLDNSTLREALLGKFTESEIFWTGAHGDGRAFIWDGVKPTVPELRFLCPSTQSSPNLSPTDVLNHAWECDYEEQWAELSAGSNPCIAAKVSTITMSFGAAVNVTELVLAACEERHQFVCAGQFSDEDQIFELFSNSLCGDGWLWNPLARVCIQYIESAIAMPNYFAASDDCQSRGGSIYNIDSKEKEFLLYNIMKSRDIQPYSVWIGEECVEVINPYIAGTASLQGVKQSTGCYIAMPYVCEKLPETSVVADEVGETTLELQFNTLNCKIDGQTAEHSVVIDSQGVILSDELLSSAVELSGTYQCLVWSEQYLTYIYSNVINLDYEGSTLPLVVTVPLANITWESWHRMVQYYSFTGREEFPTLNEIEAAYLKVVEPALQLTKSIMLDPELCPTCASDGFIASSTSMSLSSISSISPAKESGIVVTALIILYTDEVSEGQRSKRETVEVTSALVSQSDIEKYLTSSIVDVLGVDSSQSDTVQVTLSGQCPHSDVYVKELEMEITLPTSTLYEQTTMSMCAYTGTPIVSATCERGLGAGGLWNVIVNACEQEELTEATRRLRTLSLTPVDHSNFISIITETSTLIGADSNAADVTYTAHILTNVGGFPLLTQQDVDEYFEAFIETIQNLMDTSSEAIDRAEATTRAAVKVITALELLPTTPIASNLLLNENIYETVKPNIAFRLTMQREIYGVMLLEKGLTSESVTYSNSSVAPDLNNDKIVGLFLRDTDVGSVRKAFTVFGNKKFHKSAEELKSVDQIVAGTVVMADGTLVDLSNSFSDLVSLHYPLTRISLNNTVDGSQLQCGFWEVEEAVWATQGCITSFDDVNGVSCSCNHLTDFSVLLDIFGDEGAADPTLEIHYEILSIISYIGLYASIISLSLVLLTAALYRQFRKTNSQKVLAMLALCLLGRDITFVAGIEQTQTYAGCVTVAVFIHYFLLTSFAWMFVEGIIQYLRFVKVLGTYIPRFMLKSSIPAFGIPLLIVAITLAVDVDLYKASDEYCWMTKEAIYYAVMLPVGLVLLANIIVFIIVIYSLIKAHRSVKMLRSNQSQKTEVLHLVACIGVFVVLGLSWTFGYLTVIMQSSIVFKYLFCIFNTTQGLFIFIFHNVREPSVQAEWRKLFSCDKTKKSTSVTFNNVERSRSRNGNGISHDDVAVGTATTVCNENV